MHWADVAVFGQGANEVVLDVAGLAGDLWRYDEADAGLAVRLQGGGVGLREAELDEELPENI